MGANPLPLADPYGLDAAGEAIGRAIGTWGGRIIGGALGSAVEPGGGTAVGGIVGGAVGGRIGGAVGGAIGDMCASSSNNACPPCKTISGKIVPVDTIAYRPLDVIPDTEKQHGVYGSHHNIFKAKQYPFPKCDCFWQKQKWVAKPDQLQANWIPIEPFAN